jgi:hypothetical protein
VVCPSSQFVVLTILSCHPSPPRYTGPSDRTDWWYNPEVPADLHPSQHVEDRPLINRIDQLVNIDEYEGDGVEVCGQHHIPYKKIRDAFHNENRGHLSMVRLLPAAAPRTLPSGSPHSSLSC